MFHERDNEYKMLVTNFQKMSGFINSINKWYLWMNDLKYHMIFTCVFQTLKGRQGDEKAI